MTSRSVFTTSVISGLFGLYMIYALTMNSLIGIQTLSHRPTQSVPAPKAPAESRQMVENYLLTPDSNPWELEARYYVRSGQSHLYYNEWVHRPYRRNDSDNAIEFMPFAMVLEGDSDRPITMQAESARIRFSNAFSPENPSTGRPVEGALSGKVRITGPDGLEILGRNFGYSEESASIWSDEMVEFQYGNHRGRADGIQLAVQIDREKISKESFAVSGVKLITLRGKVNLEVYPENNEDVEQLIVNCDGGLVFDTKLNVATFRERVRVLAEGGFSGSNQNEPDSLNCDILKLVFAPEKTDSEATVAEKDEEDFQGIQEGLVLTEIDAAAVGRRVTFVSAGNGIEAEMDSFHYNQVTRVATLRDPADNVIVSQHDTKIYSPVIVLKHDEAGEVSSVVCDGRGELFYYDEETGELELRTSWVQQLRVTPSENSLYLIELDERAIVTRPIDQFGLAADHIKLWVSQNEQDTPAPRSATTPDGWHGDGMTPQNLLALGNVRMSHPEFKGNTNRLEVWFEQIGSDLPLRQRGAWMEQRNETMMSSFEEVDPSSKRASRKKIHLVSYQPRVLPQAIQRPAVETVKDPYYAWADLIQVLFYLGDDQQNSYVGGVVTTGDVKVQQPKADGSAPLEITGHRVEMRNRDPGNENQIIHVYGSPARVSDENVSMAGNLLNLDRSSNKAWITGPGVMMHEVYSDYEGNQLERPELLKVWWTEKMEFNGQDARFFDNVRTQLGTSQIECQEMLVQLNQKIDFQESESRPGTRSESEPEISHLECLYGVKVDSEEYEEGVLTQIRQGEFSKLIYDKPSNQTRIIGPGVISLWKVAGDSSFEFGASRETPNTTPKSGAGWEYLEIDFDGDIDGYLDQQITSFKNGANLVFGPVAQPGIKISRHELPDRAGWMRSDELDVSQSKDPQTGKPWMEFRSSGNSKLEGKDGETFYARADTITYSQQKEKYRLRSIGDRYSKIWRQKRPGDKFTPVEAKSMEYQPATNELKLEQTRSLEGIE